MSSWIDQPDLSHDDVAAVDALCDRFERCWRRGERPAIEALLAESEPRLRDILAAELVQMEVELRRSHGERPRAADYHQRFPVLTNVVEEALTLPHEPPTTVSELVSYSPLEESRRRASPGVAPMPQDTEVELAAFHCEAGALCLPEEFGRYRIERELGRGGMGAVFLAHDRELDRPVALKAPHPQLVSARDGFLERFRREGRAMATVQHPNVCPIYDVGLFAGWHFFTMAYIEGETLSARLQRGERFDHRAAAMLVHRVALAVHRIHQAGVLHRDLKPGNIMIDREDEPIVMDFGLARHERPGERDLTHSGLLVGTPAYMAPEQIELLHGEIGPPTDVYALGVILYELLCGKRPFDGTNASILGKVLFAPVASPSEIQGDVPADLEAVCLKAMSRSRADRYSSAKALADDLAAWLAVPDEVAQRKPRGDVPSLRLLRWPQGIRRERWIAALGLGVAAVVLFVGMGRFFRPPHERFFPPPPHDRRFPPPHERRGFPVPAGPAHVGVAPSNAAVGVGDQKPAENGTPAFATAPFNADQASALQNEWAKSLGEPVEFTPAAGLRFRLIPPGEFVMGAPDSDRDAAADEKPQHTVRLPHPIYAAVHEVTVGQYRRFVEATGYQTMAEQANRGSHDARRVNHLDWTWRRHHYEPADDSPVSCISWLDARQFLAWLSKEIGRPCRLPTEAEWEYLCRAGSTEPFWWGADRDAARLDSFEKPPSLPLKVGRYAPNAFGICDTHGSVWEWCLDGQRTYTSSRTEDPTGSLDPALPHVVRGGGWTTAWPSLRATRRAVEALDYSHSSLGFRVVIDVVAETSAPRHQPAFTPTADYSRRMMQGFIVLVHPEMGEHPAEMQAVNAELDRQLAEVSCVVPERSLRDLRRTRIWVDWSTSPHLSVIAHYSSTWLASHGLNPELAGGIQILSPGMWLARAAAVPPERLFAQLADQHVLRVIGLEHAGLNAAYRHAIEEKLYDAVRLESGQTIRSWATHDARSYFVTLSQSYFLRGSHFPFTRDELRQHDPQGFEVMQALWGEAKEPRTE